MSVFTEKREVVTEKTSNVVSKIKKKAMQEYTESSKNFIKMTIKCIFHFMIILIKFLLFSVYSCIDFFFIFETTLLVFSVTISLFSVNTLNCSLRKFPAFTVFITIAGFLVHCSGPVVLNCRIFSINNIPIIANSRDVNVDTTTIIQRIGYDFFSAGNALLTTNF